MIEKILMKVNKGNLNKRNLMNEKNVRMKNKIPPLNDDPIIEECVQIEKEMMDKVKAEYPLTFNSNNNDGFEKYLKCELETYSESALKLYYQFLLTIKTSGRNIIKAKYDNLFQKMGYESLADKESKELHKLFWQKNECKGC